ncbi:MAG: IS1182 family transposase [Bacteroidetes bacterium]|nr:IS1182 family transposase [Bacteroidota bacterium]
MKFIKGHDRTQTYLFPVSLDQSIDPDNEVRLIDLFADSLSLQEFGFKTDFVDNGRPAYHPADLLKLYIYGYLNKIRSSRDLEKECKRNIEVMWLLKNLQPDHNTISNFRRDNPKAIKKVFRATVQLAKNFNLIGGKLIAGDSTKFRAQNSKKNNFNQGKIDRHVGYIDKKLEEYNQLLAEQDGDNKQLIQQEIEKHQGRKKKYKQLEQQLQETNEAQISTSDPESRQMIVRNNITEVAYNVQTTVDAKHNIPVDYKVTNNNDSKAMGNMLQRAKSILRTNNFTALYDKGYHTGSEFKTAHDLNTEVMVAIPGIPRSSQSPDPAYNVENFNYDPETDCYTCPQGEQLRSNGQWYKGKNYQFKQYKTSACKICTVKHLCTRSYKNGKIVQRSEYTPYIEANKQNIEKHRHTYRKRQSIVEHPYGTIKRQWGFSYISTKKGKERASADVGFMFIAYNIRRIMNIVGKNALKKYLEVLILSISGIYRLIRFKLNPFKAINFLNKILTTFFERLLNRLIFGHYLIRTGAF